MNLEKIYLCNFTQEELNILHNVIIVSYARGAFKVRDLSALDKLWNKLQNFSGDMTREELNICNNILAICYFRNVFKIGELNVICKVWDKIQEILEIEQNCDIVEDKKIEAKLAVRASGGFALTPLIDKDGKSSSELTDSFGKMTVTEKPNPNLLEPEMPQLITTEMQNRPRLIRPEDC